MLAKEAVAPGWTPTPGISYTEFSYQILQGMDFLELHRRYGCTLQTGGSDQWGNLTAGLDLIHRVEGAPRARASPRRCSPRRTAPSSARPRAAPSGSTPALTSPYAFYQFWLNADDRDVVRLPQGAVTFRSPRGDRGAGEGGRRAAAAREAQRALAEELTDAGARRRRERDGVVAASQALFGRGVAGRAGRRDARRGPRRAAARQPAGAASCRRSCDLLAETGLSPSESAARRAVDEGGAYLNNARVTDEATSPRPTDLLHGRWLVLRRGKRNLAAVEVVGGSGS